MQLLIVALLLVPTSLSYGVSVTADSVFSPPTVGSSRVPNFDAAWNAAYAKAKTVVKKMSMQDKVTTTTGLGLGVGTCAGMIAPIESIDFPGLCLEDGPMAMRAVNGTTAFPAGINAAATFNRVLIRARGVAIGAESKGKGVNVIFGPCVNLVRTPTGGRGWETFGADPYLSGEAAFETVLGIQSNGVQANAKHFVGNEQEYARFSVDTIVDDRTLHEIYTQPFARSVVAGLTSVMCAFNRLNGEFSCSNSKIQNSVLKGTSGFRGYILSDWFATKSTSDAVNGLDMTMPGNAAIARIPLSSSTISPNGESYFGQNLTWAIGNGTVPLSRLDEMATRVLAGYFFTGQHENPAFKGPTYDKDMRSTAHSRLARDIAAASVILLKNTDKTLPLVKQKLSNGIAIIGSDARAPSNLTALTKALGALNDGSLAMGWGSGSAYLSAFSAPADAMIAQAEADGTTVSSVFDDWDVDAAASAASGKSVALVFVKTMSGEGHIVAPVESVADGINSGDRSNISAWNNGDNLIKAVAAVNKNTIVIVHSVGQMDVEQWIDHPNVTALLWAGVPGEESGNALVDILYGEVNPSGRLPYTIAKALSDYPAHANTSGGHNDYIAIPYSEQLLVDHRHFDAYNITPRFEFGFGLSYTTFAFSKISTAVTLKSATQLLTSKYRDWALGRTVSGIGISTQAWIHTPIAEVSFQLKNIGSVPGTEIVQLYITYPTAAGEPPQVLRGFDAVYLKVGEAKIVSLPITPMMLSVWDTNGSGWKRPSGSFSVTIGSSSRSPKLSAKLPLL
ncbi:glycoside hydrolase family 3 protein [Auriculariales sp. MPI-PUGE-AT-0066]|nr:glycoside hydrolase family 3 protein [Auriculariales sp. MPI-PUGE-AT-0066]